MNSTIYAPATGSNGAIGVIRISGNDAINAVNQIFSREIIDAEAYKAIYGQIIEKEDNTETILDDVIVTVFRAPHSYTGEDSVEISHHGSTYIKQRILHLLNLQGCKLADPGEFTKRAFLNGKMDLVQAEGVADLISSESKASHRLAMNQMRGSISKHLDELTTEMLNLISLLELELDFSEEDIAFANRTELYQLAQKIAKELTKLIDSFASGNAIKNGVPVAIIGAPNVGKSTLLNRLLNEERAIVSDIQGTTRDTIEDSVQIDGINFRFIDTAGIRETDDTIERIGIQRSLEAAEKAQIIILITEPGVPYIEITPRKDQTLIRITNKSESFRAIDGFGLEELLHKLRETVTDNSTDQTIITNQRHKELLLQSYQAITNAISGLKNNLLLDFIIEDLRHCIGAINEISGKSINSEMVLSNIFSKFCIGK